MEITKEIKDSVKDTIGYIESENKESFIIGTQVAFKKSEKFYEDIIKDLEQSVKNYKSALLKVDSDMRTIVNIFNKYSVE